MMAPTCSIKISQTSSVPPKPRSCLQEAGYKGEPVVLLDPANYPAFHAANLVFSEALKKAGVNVQLDTMDWSTLVTRRTKKDPAGQGGWSIFFTSNGGLEGSNPAFNISTAAKCDKAWWGWPCDPKLEELRSKWALATTLEERKKIAQQIQVVATDDVIYIPWGVWKTPSAMRHEPEEHAEGARFDHLLERREGMRRSRVETTQGGTTPMGLPSGRHNRPSPRVRNGVCR